MTSAERREGRYQRRKARRQERRQRRMAALGTLENIARFDRMYQCGKDCCRGVRWKTSIQAFEAELFLRTAQSCRLVEGGAWHPQRKPVHFTVMERGKVRPIDAPHVDDRQVQKAHSRFVLAPCYGPAMIYDNGASQQGKGLEFAYRRLKRALMRHYRRYGREGSVILCDLKEFFPSAPRRALLDRHRRYMPEGPIRALADEMVLTAPETEPGRGMPLGMEQSQQEMVALPSAVDNWLRCQMHMEAQHYMDDYVILVPPDVDAAAVLEALPLLQDEVPADGNGPGGDAPHRGRTEALPAENAPAGRQGRLGGRKGADRERQGLLQEAQRQRTLDSAADAAQRTAKGEGSMRYVCHRRARFEGISGRVNIPYGAALERRGDFLYYEGRQLCAVGSQRAHEHFKRDDDGQGLRRGALTEAICKTLERRDAGHQDRWDRVWADKLCGKYRHPDHEDHFLWGNAFFEAPIADLNYIAALVGAGKER